MRLTPLVPLMMPPPDIPIVEAEAEKTLPELRVPLLTILEAVVLSEPLATTTALAEFRRSTPEAAARLAVGAVSVCPAEKVRSPELDDIDMLATASSVPFPETVSPLPLTDSVLPEPVAFRVPALDSEAVVAEILPVALTIDELSREIDVLPTRSSAPVIVGVVETKDKVPPLALKLVFEPEPELE